jgi:hypothetical protein
MLVSRAGVPAWVLSSWPDINSSASSIPSRTFTRPGSSGQPNWPKVTPPIRSCCCSGRRIPGSPGSSDCWLCSTAPPCMALAPGTASSQSRLCLRMGFTALNRIAKVLRWEVDPDPNPEGPIQLSFEEFEDAVAMLNQIDFPMERSATDAWPDFRGWRVDYEAVAYRLCDRLTAPPAPWSGGRRHLRSGVVAPQRPPQRSPEALAELRPAVIIPPAVHRRNLHRANPRPTGEP